MITLREHDLYILKLIGDTDSHMLSSTQLISDLKTDYYKDVIIETKTIKRRVRKSIEKLCGSGCVSIIPNIFNLDGRESVYRLTEKGAMRVNDILSNDFEVYKIEME